MPGLQRLVLVLPGIGGSVLARPDDLDDVVWDAGKQGEHRNCARFTD
jgi:hypothetical protein